MPVLNTNYPSAIPNAFAGMIANGERDNRISRTIEDVAGIGFGKAAFRGAGDNGITGTPAAGTFMGITIAHYAPQPNASGVITDLYPRYSSVALLTKGVIWVVAGEDVTDGAQAYVTAGGAFVDTVGANIILPGWFFDMTVLNGAFVRLANRG